MIAGLELPAAVKKAIEQQSADIGAEDAHIEPGQSMRQWHEVPRPPLFWFAD